MKIAVLPSNQHLNDYIGIADAKVTEEYWSLIASAAAVGEFTRQGHEARMFHVAGRGDKSTDELARMIQACITWKPDLVLSIHSDYASGVKDVFPQIRKEADRAWGSSVGMMLAVRLGMPFQKCAVRGGDLMFFYRMPGLKSLLMEIGRHNVKADSDFNIKYAQYEGIMCARCFLLGSGIALKDDGTVPFGVAVPPGQEKYKPTTQQEEETEMTPEEYKELLDKLKHADKAASQSTYDVRISNRLLIGDYSTAVMLSKAFYTNWPNEAGSLPRDITVEELKKRMEAQ